MSLSSHWLKDLLSEREISVIHEQIKSLSPPSRLSLLFFEDLLTQLSQGPTASTELSTIGQNFFNRSLTCNTVGGTAPKLTTEHFYKIKSTFFNHSPWFALSVFTIVTARKVCARSNYNVSRFNDCNYYMFYIVS